MKCKTCGKELEGRIKLYCNRKCYEKYYYSTPKQKKKNAIAVYRHKIKKIYGLMLEEYNKITEICSVKGCIWKHHVELHHKDFNKKNNNPNNFVALCPNHHRLLHASKINLEDLKNY